MSEHEHQQQQQQSERPLQTPLRRAHAPTSIQLNTHMADTFSRDRPFSPSFARAHNRLTPNRPPSLLFGGGGTPTAATAVSATGLGLASSPSPYLLRSPDLGDYFSARSMQTALGGGNESPLALRRAVSERSGSADEPISPSRAGMGMIRRRSSNGSVSTASTASVSSVSSPPRDADSIMPAPRGAEDVPEGTAADLSSSTRSVSFTSSSYSAPASAATSSPASGTVTPVSHIGRYTSQPGSVRSVLSSGRSVRSSSIDVDVGVAFPSTSPQKQGSSRLRRAQPSVVRSSSGRGIMFIPRTTEAAPVSSSPRPTSFAGTANQYGIDIARNRTSLPMSPTSMTSSATTSLAGVLAQASKSTPIPDRLDLASPEQIRTRRGSDDKSITARSTSSAGSAGSETGSTTPHMHKEIVPKRTNSQSSLRTRFMSPRTAPEAVVTATSVSASHAGGQHRTTHSQQTQHPMSQTLQESNPQERRHSTSTPHADTTVDHVKGHGGATSGHGDHLNKRPGSSLPSTHKPDVHSPALAVGNKGDSTAPVLDAYTAFAAPTVKEAGTTGAVGTGVGIVQPAASAAATTAAPPRASGPKSKPGAHADATKIQLAVPSNANRPISSSGQKSDSQSHLHSRSRPQTETKPPTPGHTVPAVRTDLAPPPPSSISSSSLTPTSRDFGLESSPSPTTQTPPRPPPPSRILSSSLTARRPDEMHTHHAGPTFNIPANDDDYNPLNPLVGRVRRKQPASWHAQSDSEGETELHEVDGSTPRTTTDSATLPTNAVGSSSPSGSGSHNHNHTLQSTHAGSSSECSPNLPAVGQNGEYTPPYAVRKRKSKLEDTNTTANHLSDNHASSSKVTLSARSQGKAKARANHLAVTGPCKPKTNVSLASPTSSHACRPEPFTVTLAAAMASPLPLPFDRRRIELIVAWSAPEGLWSYVPFAKYIPTWDVHVAGTRARICGDEVQSAFEMRGLVREFVKCIPIVGRFAVWI